MTNYMYYTYFAHAEFNRLKHFELSIFLTMVCTITIEQNFITCQSGKNRPNRNLKKAFFSQIIYHCSKIYKCSTFFYMCEYFTYSVQTIYPGDQKFVKFISFCKLEAFSPQRQIVCVPEICKNILQK